MLFSQAHKCLYQETNYFLTKWVDGKIKNNIDAINDQTLINYCANYFRVKFFDLGKSFNYTRVWGKFHRRFLHYFIHYSVIHSNRSWPMERDYNIINKSFTNYTALIYFYDRIYKCYHNLR